MSETAAVRTECTPKHAQILGAARDVFLEQGYGATSMDAIAKAAKVSKATLYAHFPSKDQLFSAIVSRECTDYFHFRSQLQSSDLDTLEIGEALYRIGRHFLDMILAPQVLAAFRMVIAEAHRFPELGRAFFEAGPLVTLNLLAAFLRRADERGQISVPEPRLAAEQFLGMIKTQVHLSRLLGIEEGTADADIDRVLRSSVEVFVRGYAP